MRWLRLLDLNSYFSGAAAVGGFLSANAAAISAGAAVASLGATAYGASEQKDAREEQEDIQNQAMADADAQQKRILEQQSVENKQGGDATFNFGIDDDDESGSYDDFLTPTAPTGLGVGSTGTGLGFAV